MTSPDIVVPIEFVAGQPGYGNVAAPSGNDALYNGHHYSSMGQADTQDKTVTLGGTARPTTLDNAGAY